VRPGKTPDRMEEPNQAVLKVLRHPLRRELLRRYLEAPKPLGPKELAVAMEQPLPTVSYHVRELANLGAIEVVEEEKRRGSVAHFYEATSLVDEVPWARAALGLGGDHK
jgi:DNA-binding transcriptional ArsR family regulator